MVLVDKRKATDTIYLGLCKAFGVILHHIHICKLEKYEFEGWIRNWLESNMQRIVINGSVFRWRPVMRGAPKRSALELAVQYL